MLKITVLGLLVSMGLATASHAQFEMKGVSEKVEVRAIPFVVALRKIVPIDYDFSFETDTDLGQVVSYEYKGEWKDTLSSMLGQMDLTYRVDEDIIYISGAGSVKESSVAVVENVLAPVAVEAKSVLPAGSNYVWKVRKGFTLQETVKSWGEQVNWNVVWDSDRDFEIQSEVAFSGSFVDAASDLIDAFAKADPPVIGTFYKNNTLVIETTSNGEVN